MHIPALVTLNSGLLYKQELKSLRTVTETFLDWIQSSLSWRFQILCNVWICEKNAKQTFFKYLKWILSSSKLSVYLELGCPLRGRWVYLDYLITHSDTDFRLESQWAKLALHFILSPWPQNPRTLVLYLLALQARRVVQGQLTGWIPGSALKSGPTLPQLHMAQVGPTPPQLSPTSLDQNLSSQIRTGAISVLPWAPRSGPTQLD